MFTTIWSVNKQGFCFWIKSELCFEKNNKIIYVHLYMLQMRRAALFCIVWSLSRKYIFAEDRTRGTKNFFFDTRDLNSCLQKRKNFRCLFLSCAARALPSFITDFSLLVISFYSRFSCAWNLWRQTIYTYLHTFWAEMASHITENRWMYEWLATWQDVKIDGCRGRTFRVWFVVIARLCVTTSYFGWIFFIYLQSYKRRYSGTELSVTIIHA